MCTVQVRCCACISVNVERWRLLAMMKPCCSTALGTVKSSAALQSFHASRVSPTFFIQFFISKYLKCHLAQSDDKSGVVARGKAAYRARRVRPPSRAKVPHVTVPLTRSWVQRALMPRFETKPPGGSGMNFSEHSARCVVGGGYTQGAHLCMFPHL